MVASTEAQTQSSELSPLMRELRFNPDDLLANRNGQLSEMQQYELRVRRRRSILVGLFFVIVVAFIATLLIFMGSQEGGSPILSLIGIGLTICSAALMGNFARYWFRLTADIRTTQIHSTTGELERIIKPVTRRVLNYMVRVGEDEVFVSKEAFELFEHQQVYTLYRAPYTGTLLSVEPINNKTE